MANFITPREAAELVKDASTMALGGFGSYCGPDALLRTPSITYPARDANPPWRPAFSCPPVRIADFWPEATFRDAFRWHLGQNRRLRSCKPLISGQKDLSGAISMTISGENIASARADRRFLAGPLFGFGQFSA